MADFLKQKSQTLDSQISRTTKRARFSACPSTIESLPNDLLIEILAKVAAYSIKDLVHAKLATKEFLKASNHDYIFQHASTGNFRTLRWKIDPEFWSFMGKCVNNGNPEALYRSGMLEFFSQCREANGMKYLKLSAQKDYLEACYVYGIILYTKNLEDEGVKFLKICEEKLGFKMAHCRHKVEEFVYHLWIRNKIFLPKKDSSDQMGSKSMVKNCCKKNKNAFTHCPRFLIATPVGIQVVSQSQCV
ncbi:putative F-box protein At1g67623 [Cucurbita pepo subsp. pepo]|uniref:putative F-box protein At1g67623 n=1 Tax=Cucurbita pepo subsp. pepo TaxID=3664 RepID=UPI000C9D658C|nr:putative F-box protein At1g67623 [Cucurbita pepo subsp. pepo]